MCPLTDLSLSACRTKKIQTSYSTGSKFPPDRSRATCSALPSHLFLNIVLADKSDAVSGLAEKTRPSGSNADMLTLHAWLTSRLPTRVCADTQTPPPISMVRQSYSTMVHNQTRHFYENREVTSY